MQTTFFKLFINWPAYILFYYVSWVQRYLANLRAARYPKCLWLYKLIPFTMLDFYFYNSVRVLSYYKTFNSRADLERCSTLLGETKLNNPFVVPIYAYVISGGSVFLSFLLLISAFQLILLKLLSFSPSKLKKLARVIISFLNAIYITIVIFIALITLIVIAGPVVLIYLIVKTFRYLWNKFYAWMIRSI